MQKSEFTYDANDWRIFIDLSKRRQQVVLLHNGDKYTSLPVAHSVQPNEIYENMALLLESSKFAEDNWLVHGYMIVIGILLGQQDN